MVHGDPSARFSANHPLGQDKRPVVVAGPCSAESREQVLHTAKSLAEGGQVQFFRAGLWKPRTRPNSFEGLGEQALPWLMEAEATTGLRAITEVATPEHVEKVLEAGMSAVWIGARTTVSPFAVQAIAEALKGTDLLVMVKNPMHADLKLWIGALERVASCTRGQVCGLHRGFSSYGSSEFRNAPMWEIPIALRSEMPEVPLFCDPSHISGKAEHLQDVAQRAMNLGMEGLMIESHPSPAQALSDAEQQITPAALDQLLAQLDVPVQHVVNDDAQESLDALRLQIDSVDEQLLHMLDKRMTLAREIGALETPEQVVFVECGTLARHREEPVGLGQSNGLEPRLPVQNFGFRPRRKHPRARRRGRQGAFEASVKIFLPGV